LSNSSPGLFDSATGAAIALEPVHLIVLVVLAENIIRQSASFGVLVSM
jgi:hypothetical protein